MITAPPPSVTLRREAALATDAIVWHCGRPLRIARTYGTDAAAPVILEELTGGRHALRGQYCLWSAAAVRALAARSDRQPIPHGEPR